MPKIDAQKNAVNLSFFRNMTKQFRRIDKQNYELTNINTPHTPNTNRQTLHFNPQIGDAIMPIDFKALNQNRENILHFHWTMRSEKQPEKFAVVEK